MKEFLFLCVGCTCFCVFTSSAAEKRPLTVQDCVCLHKIVEGDVKVSPSGKEVAYIIAAPDATTNKNNYELWVRELHGGPSRRNGRLIARADEAGGLTWLADSRRITLLTRDEGKSKIVLVDVRTRTQEVVMEDAERIGPWDFSVSASGNVIAYTTPMSAPSSSTEAGTNRSIAARGYPIALGSSVMKVEQEKGKARRIINVLRRTSADNWELEKITSHDLSQSGSEEVSRRRRDSFRMARESLC